MQKLIGVVAAALVTTTVYAAIQSVVTDPIVLSGSTGAPAAENAASKAKMVRLKDGTLVVVYGDAVDSTYQAWDFEGNRFSARDSFLTWSKDGGVTWTTPVNISNTAALKVGDFDPDGKGGTSGFYGHSGKPNLFAPGAGDNILVSWTDKYCDSGVQGVARYDADPGQIEVPYGCVNVARLRNSASGVALLRVDRLTDADRDALQDVPRGGAGGLAVVWQEDPQGLQPGEAEGPGEGGSGAAVTPGTDIWYTHLANSAFASGPWSTPVRVSDNEGINTGDPGASRPNLFVGKHPDSPGKAWAMLAYEETKGSDGIGIGKHVIYHLFPFDAPEQSSAGVIISDPSENARRVRFVAKGVPGGTQGARLIIFWRQGIEGQGAPADIVGRMGRVRNIKNWDPTAPGTVERGWRWQDLDPAVAGSGDPDSAVNNEPGLNLSAANLDDGTSDKVEEDARAHRAIVVGDFIAVGYSYTPDQVVRAAGLENYDFYVRRSLNGGRQWGDKRNLSNLPKDLNVKEPRLVGTPGSGPACPSGDSADPTTVDPQDCQDKDVYYVVWGTEVNSPEPPMDLDLYGTRTSNRGATYESAVRVVEGGTDLAAGDTNNSESQLRTTPDGNRVFMIWMQASQDGQEVVFISGQGLPGVPGAPGGPEDPGGTTSSDGGGVGAGGGFCTYQPRGIFDPVLPVLVAVSWLGLSLRRRRPRLTRM